MDLYINFRCSRTEISPIPGCWSINVVAGLPLEHLPCFGSQILGKSLILASPTVYG